MTTNNDSELRVNPRSTGVINDLVYEKTTSEISLQQEADELERCNRESIRTNHIHTPELISFDESENKLVTKRIQGKELYLTIWNPTGLLGKIRGKKLDKPDVVLSRIVELGEWLSRYHCSSIQEEQVSEPLNWLNDAFQEKLKYIAEHKLLSTQLIDRIQNKYFPMLGDVSDRSYLLENQIKICKTHGDFIVYNVLIDSNFDLHVMDFGEAKVAGNIDDVVRFYSNIWAISQTNIFRKKMFLPIADKFLETYGLNKSIVNTPYFQCNMAYNFLTHLAGQHYMKHLLSPMSYFELNQITRAGINWLKKTC